METKTYNIYCLRDKIIVTDNTADALENFIADSYNLNLTNDYEHISVITDEVIDIAHNLKIEQIDLDIADYFADNDIHYMTYQI